jgi:uncharacterized protein
MTRYLDTDGVPIPVPDRDTQPYWDGTARHQLLVQHCRSCGQWIWQPRPLCPSCHAEHPQWEEIDGSGSVASWAVPHPPVLPGFADVVPFVILLAEFSIGVRMTGNLVDDVGALVHAKDRSAVSLDIGAQVSLRWREQRGWTLPCWTLSNRDHIR